MSASRLSLINILKNEFKNPAIKEKSIAAAKKELKNNIDNDNAARIFDEFPCLIPQETLLTLTEQFKSILSTINDNVDLDNNFKLTRESDEELITQWEKEIAQMAITELLNKNGIKNELIELLNWQQYKNQLTLSNVTYLISELSCSILCAFVGNVNQVIMKNSIKSLEKYKNAYVAMCKYVNPNYHTWVIEQLDLKGFVIIETSGKKSNRLKYGDILRWPIENPKPSIFLVLTGIVTAAAFTFYKKYNENSEQAELKEIPESKSVRSCLKPSFMHKAR